MNPLRIGTRGSLLAKWQAEYVRKQLFELDGLQAEIVVIKTSGDRLQHSSVTQIPCSRSSRADARCRWAPGRHMERQEMILDACVASVDGAEYFRQRASASHEQAVELGKFVVQRLLEAGATRILEQGGRQRGP